MIADKAYDTNALRDQIAEQGADAVIPPRYRRVFSCFEKLSSHYLGFLQFVCALIWLLSMSTEPPPAFQWSGCVDSGE
jgi:transposase